MEFSCKHKKLNERPQKSIQIISRYIHKHLKKVKFSDSQIISTCNSLLDIIIKDKRAKRR